MPPMSAPVAAAFATFSDAQRTALFQLREWIFDLAERLPDVGGVEETLKWGQPSYLGKRPRVGTTIRLGAPNAAHVAFYVNCQTTLVDQYRALLAPSSSIAFEKSRAVLFPVNAPLPHDDIRLFFQMALRYHLDKR